MEGLKQPEALKLEGNLASNWKIFKQRFQLFVSASGAKEKLKEEGQLVDLLLHVAGNDAMTIFNAFVYKENEKPHELKTVLTKFGEHFEPVVQDAWERWQLRQLKQNEGEKFDTYLTRLRTKAKDCQFPEAEVDNQIRDQLVQGVNSEKLREKLWRFEKLTLNDVMKVAHSFETAEEHCKTFQQAVKVSYVNKKTDYSRKQMTTAKADESADSRSTTGSTTRPQAQQKKPCRQCGYMHKYGKCPAYGQMCKKCNGRNHFAKMCRTSNVNRNADRPVHMVDSEQSEEPEVYFCGVINTYAKNTEQDYINELNTSQDDKISLDKVDFDINTRNGDSVSSDKVDSDLISMKSKYVYKTNSELVDMNTEQGGSIIEKIAMVSEKVDENVKNGLHVLHVGNRNGKWCVPLLVNDVIISLKLGHWSFQCELAYKSRL